MSARAALFAAWMAPAGTAQEALPGPAGAAPAEHLASFFAANCVRCHNGETSSGGQNFAALPLRVESRTDHERWQAIVDVLNLGAMPPATVKRRPDPAATLQVVDWATRELAAFRERQQAERAATRFRRLNNLEYRCTIRDLLGLELAGYDPTQAEGEYAIPPAEREDGFDNLAGSLQVSAHLLDGYLAAARSVVLRATDFRPRPEPIQHRHVFGDGREGLDEAGNPLHPYRLLFEGLQRVNTCFAAIPAFVNRPLPAAGTYRITVRVSGHHRDALSFYQQYPAYEPLRLAVYSSPHHAGNHGRPGPRDARVAEFEVPADGAIHAFTCEVRLPHDAAPRFAWENGGLLFLVPYADQVLGRKAAQAAEEARLGRALTGREVAALFQRLVFTDLKTPHLRLHDCEIEGPLDLSWPPPGHQLMYGTATPDEIEACADADLRRLLAGFCTRACRRKVAPDEVEDLVAFVHGQRAAGKSQLEALQGAYQAVLCSPGFLYLESPPGRLSDVDLASRLSYFLWSSLPDPELLELAHADRLHEPALLAAQVERMLADPRAQAFLQHFPECWLHLYKLGEMPPDPEKFPLYYEGGLAEAMRRETLRFFEDLLRRNGSILAFLDSDYTFANANLARLYGLPAVDSYFLQRVPLADRRRGGLLGQASILTLTANGVDTSPVLRGVWVSRNLLGTEPPAPPPGVEPIPPDLRGTRTIREQLAVHRNAATCNRCHADIDPWGVALESFDAIGGLRSHYEQGAVLDAQGGVQELLAPPVDPSYEMADGTPYADVVEFKQLLLREQDRFVHCLTHKLLTYALGRKLDRRDEAAVATIAGRLREQGFGLLDLVKLVVLSESFRSG